MKELEQLQLYIGMNDIPKSWVTCYKNALDSFEKNWILNFDFEEICSFYQLPNHFIR